MRKKISLQQADPSLFSVRFKLPALFFCSLGCQRCVAGICTYLGFSSLLRCVCFVLVLNSAGAFGCSALQESSTFCGASPVALPAQCCHVWETRIPCGRAALRVCS